MKVIVALSLLFASSQAFTSTPFGVQRAQSSVCMSAAEASTEIDRSSIRKSIANLSADNFSSTLSEIEPFLVNEAGRTTYVKSLRRIGQRSRALKVDMPENYAKEAKTTAKRREKQNTFVQTKIEEAAAAATQAAEEAAAAAEEAAAAAAAPAEESSEEEPVAAE
jgi:hypothetical protein